LCGLDKRPAQWSAPGCAVRANERWFLLRGAPARLLGIRHVNEDNFVTNLGGKCRQMHVGIDVVLAVAAIKLPAVERANHCGTVESAKAERRTAVRASPFHRVNRTLHIANSDGAVTKIHRGHRTRG